MNLPVILDSVNLICGSTNGDIVLVKKSCLSYDKDFVNDINKK